MGTKIRLMKKKELTSLAKIYVKAYEELQIKEYWDLKTAKTLIQYWMKKQPDLCFVAEVDGRIVGAFVSGIKPWWDGNHLFDGELFVNPKYQKQGIGSKLVKTLFDKAIQKYHAVAFEASTFSKTDFPLKWYASIGIKPNKELTFVCGNLKTASKNLSKKETK